MLVRKYMFDFKRLIPLAVLFCGVALLLLWPQLRYVFTDPDQGLVVYSEAWRRHAFVYSLLVEGPFRWFGDPISAARSFVLLSVAGGALWFAYHNPAWGEAHLSEEDRLAAGSVSYTHLTLPTIYSV